MASSFLCLSLLFISFSTADGFKMFVVSRCVFNSTELKDIEYIQSYYYNMMEILRFDSNVGEYVGYTEYGVKQAKYLNSQPGVLAAWRAQKETYCQHNIGGYYSNPLSKSVKPYVKLHSTTPAYSQHPAMLVCSVYDFFPSKIKVNWLRDGQEVTSDVTSTEEMADGDWYYQTHSHLEYTPRSGEKISCKVEHASLEKPLITDWDPSSSMPESERNKLAIGASGLILGLILSLAGFIYYRRKARVLSWFPLTEPGSWFCLML
ncbi:H-2 class II histocompatibility antigen, E-S beta chain-like isoform X1 [Astatotilapia calliptera]|uniref:H-2 class II histocompatibility antigen, E-S beta chain-like isoform X1 n=1 Tax=Astatotilapia calliptera TaxID=8154 RepID=UPI000E42B745|nr:H-2 class II histocompatibility antigen, E-S beta chain-like isoform X1 [Astatotilapia calliptera]